MDNNMEITTKSAEETQRFGEKFADSLKGGEILALVGNLGSGKTTFIQGLAKGLKIEHPVISPTFILMREYQLENEKMLYHIDLYRLENNVAMELKHLGVEDWWGKEENIVVIEWADKAAEAVPNNATWINFIGSGDEDRKIVIKKP
jgi:tRNA threonylcarbamoyladenosine biosynthesis protein TsaE